MILDCFLSSPRKSLSVSDVARTVGIHRATAFRFLATLESSSYIEPSDRPGCYCLSSKWCFVESDTSWPSGMFLFSVPILKELTIETGETADLGVLYRGEVVLVQVVEGPQVVRVSPKVGDTRPAHATSLGKILLAGLSDEALEEWLNGRTLELLTPNTIASPQRLRAQLAEIRQCGYAVDEQEYELGLACVAAPVRDSTGATIAAVTVSGPSSRITYHRIAELAAAVQRAGERLSKAILSPYSVIGTIGSGGQDAKDAGSSRWKPDRP